MSYLCPGNKSSSRIIYFLVNKELDELEKGMKELKTQMENAQTRQKEIDMYSKKIRELDVEISSIGYSKSTRKVQCQIGN